MKRLVLKVSSEPWVYFTLALSLYIAFKTAFFSAISWDDPELVFNNIDILQSRVSEFWKSSYQGMYMPLTMHAYHIQYLIFENWAGGYHLTSWALHVLNALLVYNIVKQIAVLQHFRGFLFFVFTLHPLQFENALWIGELKTVLATSFLLLGILQLVTFYRQPQIIRMLFILFLILCSLLCKPIALTLPLFLLIVLPFDILKNKKYLLLICMLVLLSIASSYITYRLQLFDHFINISHSVLWWQSIGLSGWALLQYCIHFSWPFSLSVLYPYPKLTTTLVITGICCWLFILSLMVFFKQKQKPVVFYGIALFIVPLLPVLQFIPFGEALYADRYMYVSVLGIGLFSLGIIHHLAAIKPYITYALGIICTLGTLNHLPHWKTETALYEQALKQDASSYVVLNSLGVEYTRQGESAKALACFFKAMRINPNNYKAFYNCGLLYLKLQNTTSAIERFNRSIALYPYTKAFTARGSAYLQRGDWPKAIADFQQALQQDSTNYKAWLLLADCSQQFNLLPQAISQYNKAIKNYPYEAESYFKRGLCYGKQNQFQNALLDFNAALRLNPKNGAYVYWIALTKIAMGLDPCADITQAMALNYENAKALHLKYCINM